MGVYGTPAQLSGCTALSSIDPGIRGTNSGDEFGGRNSGDSNPNSEDREFGGREFGGQ